MSPLKLGCLMYIPRMRFWLVLLLTLSFSLQGWASGRAASAPCPMDEGMAVMAAEFTKSDEGHGSFHPAETATTAAVDDCCNDMATFLKTGQACKTGQDCQTPAVALVVPHAAGTSTSHAVPVALSVASLPPALVAVWRPPTSI